jgi:hypothetical protein
MTGEVTLPSGGFAASSGTVSAENRSIPRVPFVNAVLVGTVLVDEMNPLGNRTGESLVAGRSAPIGAFGGETVVTGTFSSDTS